MSNTSRGLLLYFCWIAMLLNLFIKNEYLGFVPFIILTYLLTTNFLYKITKRDIPVEKK